MNVAIIIARGGSRRLPRKNVRPLCGHPLIAWSIVQAINSSEIDYVVMATDDDEIEEISLSYGVNEVIRHPVWVENAIRTFVYALKDLQNRDLFFDSVISLLPPAPLRMPGDLDRMLITHATNGSQSTIAMCRPTEFVLYKDAGFNVCRSQILDKEGKYLLNALGARVYHPELLMNYESRMSDLKVSEADVESLAGFDSFFFTEVAPWQVYETDTLEDFELCEVLMNHYILKGKSMEDVYAITS